MHDFYGRGQAVGGAGRIGNDMVPGRIILLLIYAENHRQILLFGRRGDDDLLDAAFQMLPGRRTGPENACGLDHDVHVAAFPGNEFGIALGETMDFPLPVHADDIVHPLLLSQ